MTEKIILIAGFDIGLQQRFKKSSTYNNWLSHTLIVRYLINEKWVSSIRAEYYQDKKGVIVTTGTPNGFKVLGLPANIDYLPFSNVACRIEGRWLTSKDKILVRQDTFTNDNLTILASIAVKFE